MQSEGTSLKDFIVVDKLGTGSFSSVYKVQRIDDKNYYAMKKVIIHSSRLKSIKWKKNKNKMLSIKLEF